MKSIIIVAVLLYSVQAWAADHRRNLPGSLKGVCSRLGGLGVSSDMALSEHIKTLRQRKRYED